MGTTGLNCFSSAPLVFISPVNRIADVDCSIHFLLWRISYTAASFGGISCALIGFILMLLIRPNSLVVSTLLILFLGKLYQNGSP